jgi:putative transposase
MKVSRAGYYIYASGGSYLKSEERLRRRVKEVFWFHGRKYGSRRISDELKDSGEKAGRFRVRRLMSEQELRAIQPRRFRPRTTVSDNTNGFG